jgi:HPt (histidine-containing phosphotransfer) domain-containing protein
VYDPAPLNELIVDLGPESGPIRQELIEAFLDGADDRVAAIGLAAPSDDGKALAFSAHAMKSASASLGLVALSEAAGRIESAYRDAPETMDVAFEAIRLIAHHNRATAALRVARDRCWQGVLIAARLGP